MGAKDDFDLFGNVAEMLGLDDEERENFVTSAMRRRGHKPRIDWDDNPESGSSSGGGDFFSGRRREQRQVGNKNRGSQGGNQGGGSGWQYAS